MNLWLLFPAMMAVTYLPRLLPMLAPTVERVPHWLRKMLGWLPAAAIGALVVPGILSAHPEASWLGAAGGMVAALTALITRNLLIVVVVSVGAVFVLEVLLI